MRRCTLCLRIRWNLDLSPLIRDTVPSCRHRSEHVRHGNSYAADHRALPDYRDFGKGRAFFRGQLSIAKAQRQYWRCVFVVKPSGQYTSWASNPRGSSGSTNGIPPGRVHEHHGAPEPERATNQGLSGVSSPVFSDFAGEKAGPLLPCDSRLIRIGCEQHSFPASPCPAVPSDSLSA
jgi:hypothetical protein